MISDQVFNEYRNAVRQVVSQIQDAPSNLLEVHEMQMDFLDELKASNVHKLKSSLVILQCLNSAKILF